MPSITLDIDPRSQQHRMIVTAIRDRINLSRKEMQDRHDKWRLDEEKVLAYLPEKEVDKTKRLRREQEGRPDYTTIVLPYTYAMLMTAHTYWTTVFLGRSPVHQFTGRHGESTMQKQALEALIDYQVHVGLLLVPYYIWLMDVGKYGVGIVNTMWVDEMTFISEIQEKEEFVFGVIPTGKKKKQKITQRVPGYSGNKVFNVRPYNFFPDTRVPLHRFQEGEFCAVYAEVGWNTILRRKEQGFYMNLDWLKRSTRRAPENDQGSQQLEVPDITSQELDAFGETEQRKKRFNDADFWGLYDCVIELVPNEWDLGKSNMPEKWVFTTNADVSLIVSARPQGAVHDRFPFDLMEFEPEGYGLHSRSLPEILDPIQRTMDWLFNSHFYNVRKALNHQVMVDPSRVVMRDLLDPLPGNVVRLAPSAYGQDPKTVLHQLNFVDVTQNHIRDTEVLNTWGARISGINDQIMGILQQGGRKSATEIRTSAQFGVNRLKTSSEFGSAMGFAPHAQMLVQNSQQYYTAERKFRIVGDLAPQAGQEFMLVTPEALSGFFDPVPVDGTLPIDRFAQANLWRDMFGQIARVPQIAEAYDLGRVFEWVAQLAGLKEIRQFRLQVVPDAQAAAQAQQGNVIPIGNDPTIVPEPGQVSNLGTT